MSASPNITTEGMMFAMDANLAGPYKLETGWTTPPSGLDGTSGSNQSACSGLTFMGVEGATATSLEAGGPGDNYDTAVPWTPPNDMPSSFVDSSVANNIRNSHSRSHSYDFSSHAMVWADSNSPDVFAFNQVTTPPNVGPSYFPSPTATPNMHPIPPRPRSTTVNTANTGSCTCFTVCLQSLQALHSAPTSPSFDLVLSLNRKAVESCAGMLGKMTAHFVQFSISLCSGLDQDTNTVAACAKCMRRSGTHTAAMLLATVLGTITASYKNASQSYFEQENPVFNGNTFAATSSTTPTTLGAGTMTGLGVSFGAYTVNGEDSRWLELEILVRELRKLEEVFSCFREICAELSEDPEVSKAMIAYLGQSLGSTIQDVSQRRGDAGNS